MLKPKVLAVVSAVVATTALSASPASALANDALRACDAVANGPDKAEVPGYLFYERFKLVSTRTRGQYELRCGDGLSTGAVHIERKHKVPNWTEAQTCITKAIDNGNIEPDTNPSRTEFKWATPGGFNVVVIVGSVGVVTAYPSGTDEAAKWTKCARY